MYDIQYYKDKLKKYLQDQNIDCDDIIIVNPRDVSFSTEFPTFKDVFEFLLSPIRNPLPPGGSFGTTNLAPITNASGDIIGQIQYSVHRLQYPRDTFDINFTSFIGRYRWETGAIINNIGDLYFRMDLDANELVEVEAISYDFGKSYKYPPCTYVNDPLVIERNIRNDYLFINLMRILEEVLKSNKK